MKCLRMFGAVAAIAAAFMAFAGPASATTATSSGGSFTATIHIVWGSWEMHGEAFSVNCRSGTLHMTIHVHGSSVTAAGPVNNTSLSECSFPITVLKSGTVEFHATSGGNATVTSTGAELTFHGPFGINCLYKTTATDIGTLTGGTTAKLDYDSSLIPRTGDSAFCGGNGELTGSGVVSSPDTLIFD